jgi:hypothetical protein
MALRSTTRLAGVLSPDVPVPVHRWHFRGFAISIGASLAMAVAILYFFIAMRGWTPTKEWERFADFSVTWTLLTYVWLQMGSLIIVGAGTKNQMWIDALTSIIPLFVIFYVIVQHLTGYEVLSSFQIQTAWATAYTMLLDVVVDLGVSVMLSRQVVEVGGGGVI